MLATLLRSRQATIAVAQTFLCSYRLCPKLDSLDRKKFPTVQYIEQMPDIVSKLLKRPPKDKPFEKPKYDIGYERNHTHQADLLFVKPDRGYNYLLVVVDGGTRHFDAEPLKTKNSKEIIQAFDNIYKRPTLEQPVNLQVDAGKEFQGDVAKWFQDQGTRIRVAKAGRHRQQALVEARNGELAKKLYKRMLREEYITGQPSNEWVGFLPQVIKRMNAKIKKRNEWMKKNADKIEAKEEKKIKKRPMEIILPEGTQVRVILDEPIDAINYKKLSGKFRATDIRYDPEIRTIQRYIIKLGQPVLYVLSPSKNTKGNRQDINKNQVAYTRNQLQLVSKREDYGDIRKILVPPTTQTTYIVQRIYEKKKEKGKIYYLVKYRGSKTKHWKPRAELVKNSYTKELIEEFDDEIQDK